MKLYFLIAVLITLEGFAAAGAPSVVSSSFYLRDYSVSFVPQSATRFVEKNFKRTSAFVETRFDQPIGLGSSCPGAFQPLVLGPCSALPPGSVCLNSTAQAAQVVALGPNEVKLFTFNVDNHATCSEVAFGVEAISGQAFVTLQGLQTPSGARRIRPASDLFRLCCEDLRAGSWGGEISFAVSTNSLNATVKLTVQTESPRLPARLALSSVKGWLRCPSLWCKFGSDECANEYSRPESCCDGARTLFPAQDFALATSEIQLRGSLSGVVVEDPHLLTHEFPISTKVSSAPDECHVLDESSLSLCRIEYDEIIINENNERFDNSSQTPSLLPSSLTCDSSEFSRLKNYFDQIEEELTQVGLTEAEVREKWAMLYAITLSKTWAGCDLLASSLRIPSGANDLLLLSEAACPYDPFIDSASYASDPCCNKSLHQCCSPSPRPFTIPQFQPLQDSHLSSICSLPTCAIPFIKDLGNFASRVASPQIETNCDLATEQALNSAGFSQDVFTFCDRFIHGYICQGSQFNDPTSCRQFVHPNATCSPFGACQVPCQVDSDCLGHEEFGLGCLGGICEPVGYRQDLGDDILMIKCLQEKLDPYVYKFMLEEVLRANQSAGTEEEKFQAALLGHTCQGDRSYQKLTQLDCEGTHTCNWASCILGDPNKPLCTSQNCLDTSHFGTDGFCAYSCTEEDLCQDMTFPPACVALDLANDPIQCEARGYSYNPLAVLPCQNASASAIASCLPRDQCIESESSLSYCMSYCFIPSINDEASCLSFTPSSSSPWPAFSSTTWMNWSYSDAPSVFYSNCRVSSIASLSQCEQNGQGKWSEYRFRTIGQFSSSSSCTGFCDDGQSAPGAIPDEASCLVRRKCSLPCQGGACHASEEACESSGSCNDWKGCLLPLSNRSCVSDITCPAYGWTPAGCLSPLFDVSLGLIEEYYPTPEECLERGGRIIERAKNQTECEDHPFLNFDICKLPNLPPDHYEPLSVDLRSSPRGYSVLTPSQCQECGGTMQKFFKWTKGVYLNATWSPFTWKTRNVTQPFKWIPGIEVSKWRSLYSSARARRLAAIVRNEVACKFGPQKDSLESLSCACSSSSSSSCSSSFKSQVVESSIGAFTVCSGINSTIQLLEEGEVRVPSGLSFPNGLLCSSLSVRSIAQDQFTERRTLSISASSIQSIQRRKGEARTIENKKGIIVGEWIEDRVGLSFSLGDEVAPGSPPLRVCVPSVPSSSLLLLPSPRYAFDQLGLVVTEDFVNFEPIEDLLIKETPNEICWDLKEGKRAYFLVRLVSNWPSSSYIDTWTDAEFGFLIFGLVVYFLLFAALTVNFGIYFKTGFLDKLKEKSKIKDLSLISCGLMALFMLDRFIYMIVALLGLLEDVPAADVILSELPALLFLSTSAIIAMRWAEIQHFAMSKPDDNPIRKAVLPVNVILYAFFIIIIGLYFGLPHSVKIDCTSTEEDKAVSPAEVAAYVYKAVLALVSLALAIIVPYYGITIVLTLKKSNVVGRNDVQDRIQKMLIASIAAMLTLLGSIVNIIVSAIDRDRSALSILIVMILLDILAASIVLILFNPASEFIKPTESIVTSKNSTASTVGASRTSRNSQGRSKEIKLRVRTQTSSQMSTVGQEEEEDDDN